MPFEPNFKGLVAMRNSPGAIAACQEVAERIAEEANATLDEPGFFVMDPETNLKVPKGRARVAVVAGTAEAQYAEVNERTLTRAVPEG